MFVSNIRLENFRIYHGAQEINFPREASKNVFIISGNNGFGKTTLLNSLVWCLYGKQMVDVDDKFRIEVYEAGGYKKFAGNNLNKAARENGANTYSVSISLSDLSIPTLLCNHVKITRTFNIDKQEDELEILIDGQENELTREVGQEIFVSDFILPKEIAKFFFFDAEKIVALAEIKSIDDKRNLSKAYSEVLGIKKYEDLKANLEDVRLRLRKEAPTNSEKKKLEELQKDITRSKSLLLEYQNQIEVLKEEKLSKKVASEQYQEKLIREGHSMTVKQLNDLKKQKNRLSEEAETIKAKLKDTLEIAPFAIAFDKLEEVNEQLQAEDATKHALSSHVIKSKIRKIKSDFSAKAESLRLGTGTLAKLSEALEESISVHFDSKTNVKVLLGFSEEEKNEFLAIYNNLKFSFSKSFKELTSAYRSNRNAFNKVIRNLTNAEANENDLLIKEIRQQKELIDKRIDEIDQRIISLSQEIGGLQKDIANKTAVASGLSKRIELHDIDKAKDETAERLILELESFLSKLKLEKKCSLESRIKAELNSLMHKKDFVSKVEVEISGDLIDIHLFDKRKQYIAKETLSKGEQQLYATSLLKALVDESNISFPVFIDSPLQKFDKKHSRNIITEFYPRISDQVVLFPLLDKELSELEYHMLLPKVGKAYLISNREEYISELTEINPVHLFHKAKEIYEHV